MELNERRLTSDAAEIEKWMESVLPSLPSFDSPEMPSKRPILPTHCPSCGAAIRPDEVEWLEDVTAECAYCGSPVRAEH